MLYVYILMGLGFGDDESAWEICEVYATPQLAAQAQKALQAETELDAAHFNIRVQPVLQQ